MASKARALVFALCWGAAAGVAVAVDRPVLVVAVHDGDTLTARTDAGDLVHVRVAAIDAPELDQPFGAAARAFTDALCYRQRVLLRTIGSDQYGRTLAFVVLPDGRILERELLNAGLAWWYRRFSADEDLAALEASARRSLRGLWADPSPTPPWDWRHRSVSTRPPRH